MPVSLDSSLLSKIILSSLGYSLNYNTVIHIDERKIVVLSLGAIMYKMIMLYNYSYILFQCLIFIKKSYI
ncbi:hypothetical protein EDF67_103352 [Sphingobacterium sp. JUb78]|nr:hypothetical protein [Sphingobacterium kitahiroshimense]TCR11939.1 hypothetical protein EDF67_103352 [Sphingobacterium sp. JUb78]